MIIKRPFPPTTAPPRAGGGPHAPPWSALEAPRPRAPPPSRARAPAASPHRSARTGRVAGDGPPARLELRSGRTDSNATRA